MPNNTVPPRHTFFTEFLKAYPEQDDRLTFMQRFVGGKVKRGEITHLSRLTLAAHWAHNLDDLSVVATGLYSQKSELDKYPGQKVIIFREGSRSSTLADEGMLVNTTTFFDGRLPAEPIVGHAFKGNISDKDEKNQGVGLPNINFRVHVPLLDMVVVDAGINQCSVEAAPASDLAVVYAGTLSLNGRQRDYDASYKSTAERHDIIIGDTACRDFILEIGKRTDLFELEERIPS